jgi:hypothetical protein
MVSIGEIEEIIVNLRNEGKNIREISKVVHKNFTFVGAVLRRKFPEEYSENSSSPIYNNSISIETQALKLFAERKTPEDVAIILDQSPSEVMKWYRDHWRLKNMHQLTRIYDGMGESFPALIKLYRYAKENEMSLKGIAYAAGNLSQIPDARQKIASLDRQITQRQIKLANALMDGEASHDRQESNNVYRNSSPFTYYMANGHYPGNTLNTC